MSGMYGYDECVACGHEKEEHSDNGVCVAQIMMTGPSDNMDVFDISCECEQFVDPLL